jgi:hypothetical protein
MSTGFTLVNSPLPVALRNLSSFSFGNRIFTVGGFDGTSTYQSIYSSTVDTNGNLSPWAVTAYLPNWIGAGLNFALTQDSCSSGTIYVAGGGTGPSILSANTTAIGTPNSNGSITWTQGPNLPLALEAGSLAMCNGWLYYCGGIQAQYSTPGITSVTGKIALSIVSGNNVNFTLSNGATWANLPPVNSYVYVDTGFYNVVSVLYTANAANGGYYRVTAANSTTISALKVVNAQNGTNTVTAPVGVTATSIASTNDLQFFPISASPGVVFASKIQSNGTLGPWITATSPIIYGQDSGNQSTITTSMDNFWTYGMAVGSKNYLYLFGGYVVPISYISTDTGPTLSALPTIYRGILNSGSGQLIKWDKEPITMKTGRIFASTPALTPQGAIIITGGETDNTTGNVLATTEEFKLNSDGTIQASVLQSSLPIPLYEHTITACNGFLFAIAGRTTGGSFSNTVYRAPLQNNLSF